ncbi:MAG: CRISPR-associated protein Cas6, partial [Betaproteobacteria bacterium HGW-Betaproteobacteria-17]
MNDPDAPLRLDIPEALRCARYRIEARALTAVHWPAFAGSMLRGAFGHALRRLVCVTGQPECDGCPVLGACPYPHIFETPAPAGARRSYSRVPPGFVLQPPQRGEGCLRPGEPTTFHLVLLDRATAHRDLARSALQSALATGLGREHGRLQLAG